MSERPAPADHLSRRGFLGLGAGAAASAAFLAACGGSSGSSGSGGSGGSSGTMKFWDMPWGASAYNAAAKNLVATYKPTGSLPAANYQVIQWANFTETFASAVASTTGPAVSTGGGFQPFQFAQQGAIAYADNVIKKFQQDGTYADFLPGQIAGDENAPRLCIGPMAAGHPRLVVQQAHLQQATASPHRPRGTR